MTAAAAMSSALLERREATRACVFTLSGQPFALEVDGVREVVVFEDYTPVPRTPPYVIGVANLRGEVLPIIDVQPLLGLPAWRPGTRLTTLVITPAPFLVGLVIDEVVALEPVDELVPLGDAARRRHGAWALGLLSVDGRLVPLLDATRLLSSLRP